MFPGCFSWCRLRMPWDAKKKSTEMELPEVSAHLCCAIPLSHSFVQNLESYPAIVPATTLAEDVMESTPDEVRLSFHDLRFSDVHIDSAICWKSTGRRSNKNWLRYGHRERSFNYGSICIFSDPSSVFERGHWCCTEDYSTMRGSSSSTFEGCKTID